MLDYLLENHIYFFMYLSPTEINYLSLVSHTYGQYFTNPVWYEVFIQQNNFKNISSQDANIASTETGSISLAVKDKKNHVISIDKSIQTKNIHLYQYLNLVNNET